MENTNDISKCPFHQNQKGLSDGVKNQDWWPKALNLDILHQQIVTEYNEMDHQYNIQTNAISDCAVELPPNSVECVNGDCVVIN